MAEKELNLVNLTLNDSASSDGATGNSPTPEGSEMNKPNQEDSCAEKPDLEGSSTEKSAQEDTVLDETPEVGNNEKATPDGSVTGEAAPGASDIQERSDTEQPAFEVNVTEHAVSKKRDTENTSLPGGCDSSGPEADQVQMILDPLDSFSNPLTAESEQSKTSEKTFLLDDLPIARDVLNVMFYRFWKSGFLTDLTLLVGPNHVPIKVHRVILASQFEYFRAMFSYELKESTSTEVCLPFVGSEDFQLLLKYAYSGKADLTKENVFKMAVMANYFGSDYLHDRCYSFIKNLTNLKNCTKLVEMGFHLNDKTLERNTVLFIVYHLEEVNPDELSKLPVEVLLEIVKHPAAVITSETPSKNEEDLFSLVWDKIVYPIPDKEIKYIPKLLKAIHLPLTGKRLLLFLLRMVGHIPEAIKLIMKLGDFTDPTETKEWYLSRHKDLVSVQVSEHYSFIQVDGITTNAYSPCVLINGFPFFVYITSPSEDEKEYHVESPMAIEHLGLPFEVFVDLDLYQESEWITVNVYRNGVVDKIPIREQGEMIDWVTIRLHIQSHLPEPAHVLASTEHIPIRP